MTLYFFLKNFSITIYIQRRFIITPNRFLPETRQSETILGLHLYVASNIVIVQSD